MSLFKSPLRYPGGKSRALPQIEKNLPTTFTEYREPFVGGGSLFITLKQRMPTVKFWINDLNPELSAFWQAAQQDADRLAQEVWRFKKTKVDGAALFVELLAQDTQQLTSLERGVRFFILNRITFSGVVESGGYSPQAFTGRFTASAIERLRPLTELLAGVKITNLDYHELLKTGGKEVFTFLDPPYFKATKSKLYGKKGVLHTGFDHQEFAQAMRTCLQNWLITYDDSPVIRQNFAFAQIKTWELQYGMNNYRQGQAAKGQELFILNY